MRLIDLDVAKEKFSDVLAYMGKEVKDKLNCCPTIDPSSLVKRGRWDWREEWETHHETRSCDLISCGWYCTECGIELGNYLTKKIGQYVILDDDFRKPKLARCPNCGAQMQED